MALFKGPAYKIILSGKSSYAGIEKKTQVLNMSSLFFNYILLNIVKQVIQVMLKY